MYYVGIIVPKVAEEVIQLADSLGFILIQMPKNDPTLRYNEVIYEVMKLLVNKNKWLLLQRTSWKKFCLNKTAVWK